VGGVGWAREDDEGRGGKRGKGKGRDGTGREGTVGEERRARKKKGKLGEREGEGARWSEREWTKGGDVRGERVTHSEANRTANVARTCISQRLRGTCSTRSFQRRAARR
jgi:hypothetical protein